MLDRSDGLALLAILLWACLAALGVALSHVPPFLLTGLGLLTGSVIAWPLAGYRFTGWPVTATTLLLGVYGLFGLPLLLFCCSPQPSAWARSGVHSFSGTPRSSAAMPGASVRWLS